MFRGLFISVLLHAALLAWAVISIQSEVAPPADETPTISVAIITPSELTRLKQGDPNAKQLDAKAKDNEKPDIAKQEAEKPPTSAPPPASPPPPAPEEAKAPEPEPPKPPEPAKTEPPKPDPPKVEAPKADPIADKLAALPPEPAPGPSPDELKRQEEARQAEDARKAEQKKLEDEKIEQDRKAAEDKKKADEKKKAEAKKKADEKKKAEAKKKADEAKQKKKESFESLVKQALKQTDDGPQKALIDKDPRKRGARPAGESAETDYLGPTAGEYEGRDTVLSAREADLLKGAISAQLRNCWNLPGGGGGIETMVVTLRWQLKPDGSLDGEPRIDQPQSGPVFQIAAEAAVRAVKRCQPFNLPPDKYNSWRTIIWDFDPRQML